MSQNRSYSLLTITKADEERREISGVMSTPETDRVGDQVNPLGMKARLPAPCLWQHDHGDPIGEIVWVDPKPDGIRFRAKLAKVDGPASLKERLDSYFALIKAQVVKGISIGFRPLEMEPIKTGWFIKSWELLEASVVTIPANASCSIQTVKALAQRSPVRVVKLDKPIGAPRKALPVVKLGRTFAPSSQAPSNDDFAGRPVAAAMMEAIEEERAFLEKLSDRKSMGNHTQNLLSEMMSAGAKATDAELAALRERLDRLERGR